MSRTGPDLDALAGQVTARLLQRAHLVGPEEIAACVVAAARPLGVTGARIYLADLQQRDAIRLLLAVLVLQPRDDVLPGRDADDALRGVVRRAALRVELRDRPDHGPDRGAAFRLHDHAIAGL